MVKRGKGCSFFLLSSTSTLCCLLIIFAILHSAAARTPGRGAAGDGGGVFISRQQANDFLRRWRKPFQGPQTPRVADPFEELLGYFISMEQGHYWDWRCYLETAANDSLSPPPYCSSSYHPV